MGVGDLELNVTPGPLFLSFSPFWGERIYLREWELSVLQVWEGIQGIIGTRRESGEGNTKGTHWKQVPDPRDIVKVAHHRIFLAKGPNKDTTHFQASIQTAVPIHPRAFWCLQTKYSMRRSKAELRPQQPALHHPG
jgi:hypothetical protein